jgi:hypothetical protein
MKNYEENLDDGISKEREVSRISTILAPAVYSRVLMIFFSLNSRKLSIAKPESSALWARLGIIFRAGGRTTT